MTRTKCKKTAAFNTACQKIKTPSLKTVPYHKAVEFVASRIVRDSLVRLGHSKAEASGLAGGVGGSARERWNVLTGGM